MATITKTSKRASEILNRAHNIQSHSQSTYYRGVPLPARIDLPGLPAMTPAAYLEHELNQWRSAKLSDLGAGKYRVSIAGNLWYDFEA